MPSPTSAPHSGGPGEELGEEVCRKMSNTGFLTQLTLADALDSHTKVVLAPGHLSTLGPQVSVAPLEVGCYEEDLEQPHFVPLFLVHCGQRQVRLACLRGCVRKWYRARREDRNTGQRSGQCTGQDTIVGKCTGQDNICGSGQ